MRSVRRWSSSAGRRVLPRRSHCLGSGESGAATIPAAPPLALSLPGCAVPCARNQAWRALRLTGGRPIGISGVAFGFGEQGRDFTAQPVRHTGTPAKKLNQPPSLLMESSSVQRSAAP